MMMMMMMISISTIYQQYFRYIYPPLVSNAFSGLSRGPVMFTSVVHIENNGIQITNCNFVHGRVHHWLVNRYYFDSISTVLRIDIGYTWVLYLGILPSVTAKLPDLKNSLVFWPTLYRQFCRQPKCHLFAWLEIAMHCRSVLSVSGLSYLLNYGQTII